MSDDNTRLVKTATSLNRTAQRHEQTAEKAASRGNDGKALRHTMLAAEQRGHIRRLFDTD